MVTGFALSLTPYGNAYVGVVRGEVVYSVLRGQELRACDLDRLMALSGEGFVGAREQTLLGLICAQLPRKVEMDVLMDVSGFSVRFTYGRNVLTILGSFWDQRPPPELPDLALQCAVFLQTRSDTLLRR